MSLRLEDLPPDIARRLAAESEGLPVVEPPLRPGVSWAASVERAPAVELPRAAKPAPSPAENARYLRRLAAGISLAVGFAAYGFAAAEYWPAPLAVGVVVAVAARATLWLLSRLI